MGSAVERFELNIKVDPKDIDQQGHVNNVVYLRWVVIRHEIDYKRQAFLDDEIVARTWVGNATQMPGV